MTLAAWADEGPLTLHEASVRTLESHPAYRIALARSVADEARIGQAQADYYPSIDLSLGYLYRGNDGTRERKPLITRELNNYSMSMRLQQTLADFGKRHHRSRRAEYSYRASLEAQENVAQDLLRALAETYFRVFREARGVEIRLKDVELSRQRLAETEAGLAAGKRTKADVSRAQSDLASAEVAMIQARNAEERARVGLGAAMGLTRPVNRALAAISLPEPGWTLDQTLQMAEQSLPEVRSARNRTVSAQYAAWSAAAEYRPDLVSTAGYSVNDERFPLEQRGWTVGVNLELPLLDEPFLSHGVAVAEADLVRTQAEEQLELVRACQQASEAFVNAVESHKRAEAAVQSVRRAEETFVLVQERYRQGQCSALDISNAQRDWISALNQQNQADFDLQANLTRLYHAAGQLSVDLFLPPDQAEVAPAP